MSEEQNAAQESGEQTAGHETPVKEQPRQYTEADIHEMRMAGDHEGVRKAVEQLQRQAQGEEPLPQEAPQDSAPKPEQPQPQEDVEIVIDDGKGQPAAEDKPTEKKTFDVPFRGTQKSYNDSDGYLGFGDFGRMKKSYAHAMAKLDDFEMRLEERNGSLGEAMQKVRSLTERNEALQNRVQELERAPKQTGKPQQKPLVEEDVDLPELPEMPDLPADVYDWTEEDKVKDREYRKARAVYDKAVAQTLKKISTRKPSSETQGQQQAELPPEVKEAVEFFRKHKNKETELQRQESASRYWEGFRSFQKERTEFQTPVDIQEMNQRVIKWMDRLAYANGYDLKPGATQEERARYESVKRQLAFRYAKGDSEVLANSESAPAPEGYEAYVKIANLDKTRKDLINRGILGKEAGLEEAWLHSYAGKNGTMNDDIKALETNAATRGASEVVKSLEARQANNAINLPNGLSGGAPAQSSGPQTVSQEEARRLVSMSPIELASNPELAAKREKVVRALEKQAGYAT